MVDYLLQEIVIFFNTTGNNWSGYTSLISVDGRGYSINGATFSTNGKTCINSTNLTLPSNIYYSTFNKVGSANTLYGVFDNSSTELFVFKSTFNTINTAIYKNWSKLTVSCNTFNCPMAIYATSGCLLNLSSEDHGGYNVFNCSGNAAIQLRTSDINLRKGYNKFSDLPTYYVTGSSYNTFNSGLNYIDATYNQWNTANTTPGISKFNLKIPTSLTNYTFNTSPVFLLPSCWAYGGAIPVPPMPNNGTQPKNSGFTPLIAYYGDTVTIDTALVSAMNKMKYYNEFGNDLDAIADLNELFKNNLDKTNPNIAYYLNFGLRLMKTAIENAVSTKDIDVDLYANNYENHIQMYANALMKMTDDVIDSTNFQNQFYIELNKAHLFRLNKRSDIGLNILSELETCGLDSLGQAELNYWKKQFELDLEVIEIGINAVDSTITIDTSNYQIPTDLAINQFHFGADIQNMNNISYPNCNYFQKANLEELLVENGIVVYPNPAKNEVNFHISNSILSNEYRLILLTNDGRIVHESIYSAKNNSINDVNISNCKNGIYHYKIILSTGEIKQGQFVINK